MYILLTTVVPLNRKRDNTSGKDKVSEVWESYPLEFILILFEDSDFLIDVNYSLLLSSYRLVKIQIKQ